MDEEVEIILQSEDITVEEPTVAGYILPKATANTLGGVKIGNNINSANDGTISVYYASTSNAGVIKVGSGLSINNDGVLSSTGGYDLPQATTVTLGGVYLDDALSNSSTNPVQNSVIKTALDNTNSNVSNLSSTVSSHTSNLASINSSIDTFNTTIGSLNDQVEANTANIEDAMQSVSDAHNDIINLQSSIDAINDGLGQFQGNVDPVLDKQDFIIHSSDVSEGTWLDGSIEIVKRGYTGLLNCYLTGGLSALSIPAGDYVTLCTLDPAPSYMADGYMYCGSKLVRVSIETNGNFNVYNDTNVALTTDRIIGGLPIMYN